MRSTKKSLIMSTISLVLCFAMLLGSTYAWFTDEVTSGVNQIKAGNLDVELYAGETKVTESTKLFTNIEKWEPGMIAYENFTVKNVGNLALKYQLSLTIGDKNATSAGHSLDEVLKATIVPGGFNGDRTAAQALTGYTTLENFSTSSNGALLPAAGDTFGVVIYWQPTDNDNDYNLNNGKTAVPSTNFGATELGIELGVKLTAQQLPHEEDSFDKFYDKADNEVVATWSGESEEKTIPASGDAVTMQVMEGENVRATATVEAGTQIKVEGQEGENFASLTADETLKLTIEPDGTPNGITVDIGESVTTYDVSLIKVVTTTEESGGESKTTTEIVEADKPVLVSLDIGVVDLQRFYHHGTELTKVNDKNSVDTDKYYYDQTTGMVYFKTISFSPFASVYKFAGGIGTENYPYLLGNEEHFLSLKEGFTTTTENVNFKFLNDMDMGKASIQSKKGHGWGEGYSSTWFDRLNDYANTNIVLDLNNHAINNLSCFLFTEIYNLQMKNGTVNFVDGDTPGIIYSNETNAVSALSFENLTLNGDYEVKQVHYGPILTSCYGHATAGIISCTNVKSNVTIRNVDGGSDTGGILGYINIVAVSFNNCEFSGYILSSNKAAGFIGSCNGTINGENNIMSGTVLAANTAKTFCSNKNDTDYNSLVSATGQAKVVPLSSNLLKNSIGMNEEIKVNHQDVNIKRYAVSIMIWTNHATCGTIANVDVTPFGTGELSTGLYKNYFENAESDGSTEENKVGNFGTGIIWKDGDTYKFYAPDSMRLNTSMNATIYVYGYNEAGEIVTWQTQSYAPAKPA